MSILRLILLILGAIFLIQTGSPVVGSSVNATLREPCKTLCLRGEVESFRITPNGSDLVFLHLDLKMELINEGTTPILLLNREPLFVGATLARTSLDALEGNDLASDYVGPGFDTSLKWRQLRADLDKPEPPPEHIRILKPGERWPLEAKVGLSLPTKPSRDYTSRRKEMLSTIMEASPVWTQAICEVWSLNLEWGSDKDVSRRKFGSKLQKKWSKIGQLWLYDVYSEPIMLDLKNPK